MDNLAAWDCRGHLKHILCLLYLASRITMLAQYHIGGFLWDTLSPATTSKARHEIVTAIATSGFLENRTQYRDTLSSCGCESCISALGWREEHGVVTSSPAERQEVLAKFANDYLANATPTFANASNCMALCLDHIQSSPPPLRCQ